MNAPADIEEGELQIDEVDDRGAEINPGLNFSLVGCAEHIALLPFDEPHQGLLRSGSDEPIEPFPAALSTLNLVS